VGLFTYISSVEDSVYITRELKWLLGELSTCKLVLNQGLHFWTDLWRRSMECFHL